MPYQKFYLGAEVRSSPSEGEGLLRRSTESVTEGETLSSEIVRTAICALDEAPPDTPLKQRQLQAFMEEAVRMLWRSVVAERPAAVAEALVCIDNATLV